MDGKLRERDGRGGVTSLPRRIGQEISLPRESYGRFQRDKPEAALWIYPVRERATYYSSARALASSPRRDVAVDIKYTRENNRRRNKIRTRRPSSARAIFRFFPFFFLFFFFFFFAAATRFTFAVAAKFHVVQNGHWLQILGEYLYIRTYAFGQSSELATRAVTLPQFAR